MQRVVVPLALLTPAVARRLAAHLGPEDLVQHAENRRVVYHLARATAGAVPLVWRQRVGRVLHDVNGIPQASWRPSLSEPAVESKLWWELIYSRRRWRAGSRPA